ncbi:MAG: peptide deformylase [Patescibacteria group bacterium]|nr:peptide deformylase [Patescibacteria group bacterium]
MNNSSWQPVFPPGKDYKKDVFGKIIKTGQFIYQIGESENLSKPSREVSIDKIKSPKFKSEIKYLKECMSKYRKITGAGRGITAVQVGIPERFSVVYMPEIKGKLLIIINPKITKKSKKLLKYPEMCMSAEPIIAPVIRPAWIEFEYYDEKGKKRYWKTKDMNKNGRIYNRVFQHEIDHMDGIINIDKVNSKELVLLSDLSYYEKAKFERA